MSDTATVLTTAILIQSNGFAPGETLVSVGTRIRNAGLTPVLLHRDTKLPVLFSWNHQTVDAQTLNDWTVGYFSRMSKENAWADGNFSSDAFLQNVIIGVLCDENDIVFDGDKEGLWEQITAENDGKDIRDDAGYGVQSRRESDPYKMHLYFRGTAYSKKKLPTTVNASTVGGRYDMKIHGQVVAAGCIHSKTGKPYLAWKGKESDRLPIPNWFVDWIVKDQSKYEAAAIETKKDKAAADGKPYTNGFTPLQKGEGSAFGEGERYPHLQKLICSLRSKTGFDAEELFDAAIKYADKHFPGYTSDSKKYAALKQLCKDTAADIEPISTAEVKFAGWGSNTPVPALSSATAGVDGGEDEDTDEPLVEIVEDMPTDCLDGMLGDITQKRMARFPIATAWPTIVCCAGVRIERECSLVLSPQRTNLYVVFVCPVEFGKSDVINQGLYVVGLVGTNRLLEATVGSSEGLISLLGDAHGESRLYSPDELLSTLKKANIENSVLNSTFCSMFYKDASTHKTAKGTLSYNARVSMIGGIVDDMFEEAYGVSSTGGFYTRSAFSMPPTGFVNKFRPYDTQSEKMDGVHEVTVDLDVYELQDEWNAANPGYGRVMEIAIRFAFICACYDKRVLHAKDMDAAIRYADYHKHVREVLRPNVGETLSAKMEDAIRKYLTRRTINGDWVAESRMGFGLRRIRERLGTKPYEYAVTNLIGNNFHSEIEVNVTNAGRRFRIRMNGGSK
jgi:hypothetical protein